MNPDIAPKNLAMLLTPAGSGAIAVIRIVGPSVESFLQTRFSGKPAAGRCVHGDLCDESERVLDDIVVVLLPDRSAADLNLHGGPWVIESVRQLLERDGFVPADELPSDAGDGATLIEREMIAHLPFARTEPGIRMLLAQPTAWQKLEASNPSAAELAAILADQTLSRLLNPARVAIVGVPNVGKSTLANQLFGQERSITADLPGTTRDWIGELADLGGLPVLLLDTPGVRSSDDAIEQSAIALSRRVIDSADLVIVVIDPTQPRDVQMELARSFPHAITVLNKKDLGGGGWPTDASTVATTGDGVDQLHALIRSRLGCGDLDPERPRCWTDPQRRLLADKLNHLPGSTTSY